MKEIILEVRSVDLVEEVGLFKFENSENRDRWAINIPSKLCTFYKGKEYIFEGLLLEKVVCDNPVIDHITKIEIFFGDYDWHHYCVLSDYLDQLNMEDSCIIKMPRNMLSIVNK